MFWYSKGLMLCGFIGILLVEEETNEYIVYYCIPFVLSYDFLIGVMKFLMRRKEFVVKLLGINLCNTLIYLIIYIFTLYFIINNIIGLGGITVGTYYIITNEHWHFLLKSNHWAYMFLMIYFGDTLGFQPVLIVLKTIVTNMAIGKGHKFAMFIKWLFIFWEENILFRNLLKDARNIFG